MEKLGYDASTALPDVDMHLDVGALHDYSPHDYDGHVRGPVRLREALGNSLNIPAVWTAHAVGADALLERLHALGFASLHEDAEFYGPALALGDGEVTLLELCARLRDARPRGYCPAASLRLAGRCGGRARASISSLGRSSASCSAHSPTS